MRTALIDGDLILYEVSSCSVRIDPETKEESLNSFDYMRELMDKKIGDIVRNSGGLGPPLVFLTGPNNFRKEIAKRKKYKGNRDGNEKPYHYENLRAYLTGVYNAVISNGVEADDLICLEQTKALAEDRITIICSRDKDLRQCQGLHYSWECGKQPEKRTYVIEGFGTLEPKINSKGKIDSLIGTGDKWFLAQLLIGDTTDNIPGLPKYGPVKALHLLRDAEDYLTGLRIVANEYKNVYGNSWVAEIFEQAELVYMLRNTDSSGNPLHWMLPQEIIEEVDANG